jgi:hypothetical protein
MKEEVKSYICYVALIALSIVLLWAFSSIWRYGEFTWFETNKAILSLETGICIAFIALGLERIIRVLK